MLTLDAIHNIVFFAATDMRLSTVWNMTLQEFNLERLKLKSSVQGIVLQRSQVYFAAAWLHLSIWLAPADVG